MLRKLRFRLRAKLLRLSGTHFIWNLARINSGRLTVSIVVLYVRCSQNRRSIPTLKCSVFDLARHNRPASSATLRFFSLSPWKRSTITLQNWYLGTWPCLSHWWNSGGIRESKGRSFLHLVKVNRPITGQNSMVKLVINLTLTRCRKDRP